MMKKKLILLAIITIGCLSLQAQSKAERKATKKEKTELAYQEMKSLVESGKYEFEANWAFPLGNDVAKISNAFVGGQAVFQGNRINLTGNSSFIRMNGEVTNIYLPYFGQVTRGLSYAGTGGDNGLNYKGEIENHKVKYKDSRKQIDIKFNANKSQEKLQVYLIITPTGECYVNINSSNRDSIRYQGKLKALEDTKTLASN